MFMKSQYLDKNELCNKLVLLELCPVEQFWYASPVNMVEFQAFLTRQI